MVRIAEFAVERWMDDYENDAKFNLAETCCASISLNDLLDFSEKPTHLVDFSRKQVYGAIRGSEALRLNIAKLYSSKLASLSANQVLVTNGAIQANFLALYSTVNPGDHVICHYPTYQQLYAVPESLGAEVSLWRSKEEDNWRLDLDELRSMIRPSTKLIIINNPQNPTGAIIPSENLHGIVDVARQHGIAIHSDEVYRPLFHSLGADKAPPSILSFGYENVIATGSMSKAFSLAGIRLGWIASNSSKIINACASTRDYTTISVSQIDDVIATFALSDPVIHGILQRNFELASSNLQLLDKFIQDFAWAAEWIRPKAGTTAFVKFFGKNKQPLDAVEFCQRLQSSTGAMVVPGSQCFGGGVDFKGFVRFGFVPERQVMIDGLEALRRFMLDGYDSVPTV
ncbi:aminotransferase [Penicillium maclennaniae]|uniref:aminotransferase n=1 Tax=Penicillium maclennaniae TaxID=1343394 RepID=UPI002541B787|nr:aminotransferase [Penicillium maclennaniae]KAJ5668201.1 aminotransferase [Penicillium maclennaniae]